MKQDFLTPEAGKTLAPQDNVVTSSERDPRLAAAHFMQQLAVSALDMPTFKNKGKPRSAEIQRHLPMGDREFVESVFHHALRPQLMVPTAVNLNTRGGILDMPIAEAPRHGVSPQQGPAKMQASAAAHTTDP
jgi:hypothetical protein